MQGPWLTKTNLKCLFGYALIMITVAPPALAESFFTGLGILPGGTFSTTSFVGGSLSRDGTTAYRRRPLRRRIWLSLWLP